MAVDTAVKRYSALHAYRVPYAVPLPDGTIAVGDRQTLAGAYSGIATTAAAVQLLGLTVTFTTDTRATFRTEHRVTFETDQRVTVREP